MRLLFFVFLCSVLFAAPAQVLNTQEKIPTTISISVQESVGKNMSVYPGLPQSHAAYISEMNFIFQTRGKKKWHAAFHFPEVGIASSYGMLGLDSILGRNVNVIPHLIFRSKNAKNFGTEWRIGMGASYFNKPYSLLENPKNGFIGSSITYNFLFSYLLWKNISPTLRIHAGLSLYHFSNGHYQLPNVGYNMPAFSIGIKSSPSGRTGYGTGDTICESDKKFHFTAKCGYGIHEFGSATGPTNGPKFPIYNLAFYVQRRYAPFKSYQIGIITSYYTSFYDHIIAEEIFHQNQRTNAATGMLILGHEYFLGHIGIVTQLGIYFFNPFYSEEVKLKKSPGIQDVLKKYNGNRLAIHYYFLGDPGKRSGKNLFIGTGIKTNLGQADFAEWSIGFTF